MARVLICLCITHHPCHSRRDPNTTQEGGWVSPEESARDLGATQAHLSPRACRRGPAKCSQCRSQDWPTTPPDEGSWAGPGPQPASGPRKASLSPRAAAPNDDTYSGLKQLHLFSPGFGGQESRDQRAGCLWRLQGGNPLAFQPLLSLLASRAPRPMQPLPQPRPCPRPQGLLFPGRRLQLLPQQTDAP